MPILMLTARAEEIDTVVGLDAGADDYVDEAVPAGRAAWPGSHALLRRTTRQTDESLLEGGRVRIDVHARRALGRRTGARADTQGVRPASPSS